jgi:ABC-type lipoprotein release transport system permease subunit
VLAGALLVGDSVRGSLRDLVLERLGSTDYVVNSTGFVREQLAADLLAHPEFATLFDGIAPMVIVPGFAEQQLGGGRAGGVQVYGVDNRFWQFHGVSGVAGPEGRDALISPALASELGADEGATILVRVQRPSEVPIESLHGRKDDLGRTLRVMVRSIIVPETLGEFSLQAQQGAVRAVFVPLELLQRDLGIDRRVNALLVSAKSEAEDSAGPSLERMVRDEAEIEDLGLRLRVLDGRAIALEADGGLIDNVKMTAAERVASAMALEAEPVFTYLVNSLRSGGREIPYSLITGRSVSTVYDRASSSLPPIVLNDWAARDLGATRGSTVTLEYFVWEEPGRLVTRTTEFSVDGVVPMNSADRDLAPVYPGITESATLTGWDPPFPIDLRRIRPVDEEYWEKYRTTPKGFIPIEVGQELWGSRYGSTTSIRITPAQMDAQTLNAVHRDYADRLRRSTDPLALGLTVQSVRTAGLEASRGATNFGEYFVYFSFFIVASALLLTALFFKLSVEQRAREVGLLRAVGIPAPTVRRLFLIEGLLLAAVGAVAGVFGGVAYGYAMVAGLRTWWLDAIGTTALTLNISPASLATGALAGIVAAMICIWVTLRGLASISERSLLAGQLAGGLSERRLRTSRTLLAAIALAAIGVALVAGAGAGLVRSDAAFFGAGSALLAACLCFFVYWFGRPIHRVIEGQGWAGWASVSRLGLRSAAYRPARSVLSMAMIASATFILISVDAFRKDSVATGVRSGTGGYPLLIESLIPIVHDPDGREGREVLGIAGLDGVKIEPFRVRPGDDTSCLNLYEPGNPRILAPQDSFLDAGRFTFRASLAANESERANPWLLLRRDEPDGAIPVIADANSLTYVLHREPGDDFIMMHNGRETRLRFVAALEDSIFQSELLMSQANFLKLFPEREGYQFFLAETPSTVGEDAAAAIETALTDYGADARSTSDRLAEFHRVENTYLSTFQMLGGLGLLLGTIGLGAVLIRNVMERRRELALLRAVGYQHRHFFVMIVAENAVLLLGGLFTGAACALLAITPVWLEYGGGRLPAFGLVTLLAGVLVAGLLVSWAATASALRSSVLSSLRSE